MTSRPSFRVLLLLVSSALAVPSFGQQPSDARISGLDVARANDLVARLRLGDLPIAPVLLRQATAPAPR